MVKQVYEKLKKAYITLVFALRPVTSGWARTVTVSRTASAISKVGLLAILGDWTGFGGGGGGLLYFFWGEGSTNGSEEDLRREWCC